MSVTATVEATARTSVQSRSALTAHDRCDRCGAQAYVALEKITTGEARPDYKVGAGSEGKAVELLFCAHHNREHGPELMVQGAMVTRDETHKLEEGNRQVGESH